MKTELIGTAVIKYNEDNTIKSGVFKGSLERKFDEELIKQLQPSNNLDEIKNNADMALASWFNKITEIEISDRENSRIVSAVKKRTYYSTGNIKKCEINYFFETESKETKN